MLTWSELKQILSQNQVKMIEKDIRQAVLNDEPGLLTVEENEKEAD
jgi:hypothetical protein